MISKKKKFIIAGIVFTFIIAFYILTKNVSPDALKIIGGSIPLPLFTLIIGFVDGFNPCNLFVLTMLLSLILTEAQSRKKIFIVGFTFIGVVYAFYYLFMAAWLNIFRYIGFITPLRITIGVIALIAGIINMKELFFFRKGISLMVQNKNVAPLKRRIQQLSGMMKKSSIPTLLAGSALLAVFASLVELPCTAGFPIIYAGILSGHFLDTSLMHYLYLALYNLFYVLPLLVIITVFGYTFKGKQISKDTMSIIKFIGGAIMLLLGILLLANPALIGLA